MNVPFLSVEAIAAEASRFLELYGNGQLPVEIEWIIEDKLRIDIIPTPSLRQVIAADAFITSDLTAIYVDDSYASRYPRRYRFTLAHEIGHWHLHGAELKNCRFRTIGEYKEYFLKMQPNLVSRLELQSDSFASYVLMPPRDFELVLDAQFQELLPSIGEARQNRLAVAMLHPYIEQALAESLAATFEVSSQAAKVRLGGVDLLGRIRDAYLTTR